MLKIYKFPLLLEGAQDLLLPIYFKPLDVQLQGDKLCLWALVDPALALGPARVNIYGTGFELPDRFGEYVATVQQGPYVWHVFIQR